MTPFAAPVLLFVAAAPAVAALALAPIARAPWLGLRLAGAVALHVAVLVLGVSVALDMLDAGGFVVGAEVWRGARAEAVDPLGLLPLVLSSTTAPLLVAVHLAAALAAVVLVPSAQQARSSAQHTALLLATSAATLLVLARRADAVAAAFSLTGLAGFALLAAALPRRDEGVGALRAFVLHRIGDAAMFAGVVAIGGVVGGVDVEALLAAAAGAATPMDGGPLAGHPPREVWVIAAALVACAAATRLAFFPLQPLVRDAVGAPGAALGFVWGACFVGAGLVVLVRLAPLLALAPPVLIALGAASLGSALVGSALAMAGRDIVRIDVHLLAAFGALPAFAVAALDVPAAVLGACAAIVAAVLLFSTTGAVAHASGRVDPLTLGGLERRMPRTHTARLLASGALFGPFLSAVLLAHALHAAQRAPWLGPRFAVASTIIGAALAFAAFRVLHLVFTGAEPREPLAAPAADPAWRFVVPPLLVAIALFAIGLLHLPPAVAAFLPGEGRYFSPWGLVLGRDVLGWAALRLQVLPPAAPVAWGPGLTLALAVGAPLFGVATSNLLYRGGPGPVHRRVLGGPRAQRVLDVLARFAGRESQVARGVAESASRLSRIVATNLMPGLLEALLRRIPALVGGAVGTAVRFLANGSAQRGLAVALLGLALLAARWGGLWGTP